MLVAVNGDQIHSWDSLDPNDSFLLSSKSARTSLCGLAASNCWSCFLQIVYLNHVNIDYIWDFTNPKNVPKLEEHVIQTLPQCPPRLRSIWWLICVCQMSGASHESDEELKLFSIRWRNIRGASLWSADSEEAAGYNKEVWSAIFLKNCAPQTELLILIVYILRRKDVVSCAVLTSRIKRFPIFKIQL